MQNTATWKDARATCNSLLSGADLVAIESEAEHEFVTNKIIKGGAKSFGSEIANVWTGCNDLYEAGSWVWASTDSRGRDNVAFHGEGVKCGSVDGEGVFHSWSNKGPKPSTDDKWGSCTNVFVCGNLAPTWVNVGCDEKRLYICEATHTTTSTSSTSATTSATATTTVQGKGGSINGMTGNNNKGNAGVSTSTVDATITATTAVVTLSTTNNNNSNSSNTATTTNSPTATSNTPPTNNSSVDVGVAVGAIVLLAAILAFGFWTRKCQMCPCCSDKKERSAEVTARTADVKYNNPAYAQNTHFGGGGGGGDGGTEVYAEVADLPVPGEPAYEEPSQRQSQMYESGVALGAADHQGSQLYAPPSARQTELYDSGYVPGGNAHRLKDGGIQNTTSSNYAERAKLDLDPGGYVVDTSINHGSNAAFNVHATPAAEEEEGGRIDSNA